jgi:hypothetical protein
MAETCAAGYKIATTTDFTKGNFVELCELLTEKFNEKYESKEYSFEPEAITEGGIIFKSFPESDKCIFTCGNEKREKYKTMRIYFNNTELGYPWINKDVMTKWKIAPEKNDVIVKKGEFIGTSLKSQWGAPIWTIEELQIFEECFKKVGIIRCTSYPKEEDLIRSMYERLLL